MLEMVCNLMNYDLILMFDRQCYYVKIDMYIFNESMLYFNVNWFNINGLILVYDDQILMQNSLILVYGGCFCDNCILLCFR